MADSAGQRGAFPIPFPGIGSGPHFPRRANRFSIPANPTALRVVPRPSGRTDVILTSPPFSRGRIENPMDLRQWTPLRTYEMNEDGYLVLEGLLSTDPSHRFFRIVPE